MRTPDMQSLQAAVTEFGSSGVAPDVGDVLWKFTDHMINHFVTSPLMVVELHLGDAVAEIMDHSRIGTLGEEKNLTLIGSKPETQSIPNVAHQNTIVAEIVLFQIITSLYCSDFVFTPIFCQKK